ncbi:hypothetical protein RAB80_002709 [Fusarium oxysporum f. sp. vasinfectum]|nr:hypothetical protein RAB80_002709 [Fusarium oxysporum f. sp. vasinfectum]KAK2934650.1 hypothetical protein FoTM2_005897 [Fusarium oxysporum f. sp. vasinfectum]
MAAEKPDKKEKKDKKRSDESGVSKSKKEKKDKKDKKEKLAAALEEKLQQDAPVAAAAAANMDEDSDAEEEKAAELPLERTVVPFALPVADEKGMKKVYKTIRKAAKNNTLKRGVKEVVKTLRKSPPSAPGNTSFPGVDHNVPFIFVTSRAELGAAAKTKRPTSVVMIMEKAEGKKSKDKSADKDGEDDGEAFGESYASLVKYVQKEYGKQAFWVKGGTKY